jgi:hypothetical protein
MEVTRLMLANSKLSKGVPQRQSKRVDYYLKFETDCSQSKAVVNCGIECKTSRSGLKRRNDGSISGYIFTND